VRTSQTAQMENIQSELLDAFMDVATSESRSRDKAAAQRRLAARRAIEQHFERKALEPHLHDYWFEDE